MTEYALGSWDRVSIWEGSFGGECHVRCCTSASKFMVFIDDGAPKMSRLFANSCAKHLVLAVRKGWTDNKAALKKARPSGKRSISRD